jgi:hypothetical protein
MKRHTYVALLATLMSASAWGQEVSLYGTTMAQMWKGEVAGVGKESFTPATQFLGIDASKLGSENLSLHLFGWGKTDLSNATTFDGTKSAGYLNTAYLQYQFSQANAEIKAGRFTINQTTGWEQVDGVSARTDLKGGFAISAFAGRPVLYKTVDPVAQKDYEFQNNLIFGSRLSWRNTSFGELGLTYLQDGTKAAKDLTFPSATDYTRKQLGVDVLFAPTSSFDVRGKTVADVRNERTNVAEHDYTASVKLGNGITLSGNFAERNFLYYFAGTNLPSLFRPDENDMFRGFGFKASWVTAANVVLTADYKHTHRESFGDTNRAGGDARWSFNDRAVMFGFSGHVVNAVDTTFVDPKTPYKSLSHREGRGWVMLTKGKFSCSLDGILQRYDEGNPYLAGLKSVYEVVGSLGYQASTNVKVSGDVSYGSTPLAKHETRGLLRAEYRFGMASKGGR